MRIDWDYSRQLGQRLRSPDPAVKFKAQAELDRMQEHTARERERIAAIAADERKARDTANARRAAADDSEIQSGRTNVGGGPMDGKGMLPPVGGSTRATGGGDIAAAVSAFQARL